MGWGDSTCLVQRRVRDGLGEFAEGGDGGAGEFWVQDVVFGDGKEGDGIGACVYSEEVLRKSQQGSWCVVEKRDAAGEGTKEQLTSPETTTESWEKRVSIRTDVSIRFDYLASL